MKCSYSKEHGIFWAHLVRKEIEKAIVSQGKKLRNPRGCPQATVISCNCRIKKKTGLVSNILTALQCQRNNQLEIKKLYPASRVHLKNYYSFKIFVRFWLAKIPSIIHHNQLLSTKFGRIL